MQHTIRTDLALITPKTSDLEKIEAHIVPVGLAVMAAYIQRAGFSVAWLDLHTYEGAQAPVVDEFLRRYRPRVVGISGVTCTRFLSFEVAEQAKALLPDSFVAYGGPHASFTASDTLCSIPDIDVVVRGEGELTLLEVMQRVLGGSRSMVGIRGVSYRDGGQVVHEAERPRIVNLSELPWPDYDMINGAAYLEPLPFCGRMGLSTLTSRGCPYRCSFCSIKTMWGSKYSYRNSEDVLDELSMLKDRYGIGAVSIYDSLFSLNRKRVEGLCQEFIDRNLGLKWKCELRADTIDQELLRLMSAAGCYMVSMGLESVDSNVLTRIHKGVTPEQVLEVVEYTRQAGMKSGIFLMCGNPGETLDSARKTLEFRKQNLQRAALISFSPAHVYPGTELEAIAKENGCLPPDWSWSAPYFRPEHVKLRVSPEVPVFTQPGFGYLEYRCMAREYFFQTNKSPYFTPAMVCNRLRKVKSLGEFRTIIPAGFKTLKGIIAALGIHHGVNSQWAYSLPKRQIIHGSKLTGLDPRTRDVLPLPTKNVHKDNEQLATTRGLVSIQGVSDLESSRRADLNVTAVASNSS